MPTFSRAFHYVIHYTLKPMKCSHCLVAFHQETTHTTAAEFGLVILAQRQEDEMGVMRRSELPLLNFRMSRHPPRSEHKFLQRNLDRILVT